MRFFWKSILKVCKRIEEWDTWQPAVNPNQLYSNPDSVLQPGWSTLAVLQSAIECLLELALPLPSLHLMPKDLLPISSLSQKLPSTVNPSQFEQKQQHDLFALPHVGQPPLLASVQHVLQQAFAYQFRVITKTNPKIQKKTQ